MKQPNPTKELPVSVTCPACYSPFKAVRLIDIVRCGCGYVRPQTEEERAREEELMNRKKRRAHD